MEKVYIKNMVCPRCIDAVTAIFRTEGIDIKHVKLGEVELGATIEKQKKIKLSAALNSHGFELLQDKSSKQIEKIKNIVIDQIRYADRASHLNYSSLLSESLNQEYTSLSRLFSSVEGMTIERYIVHQKIEYVKELLFYDELTLSEIANKLNYSSVSHLSAQFKKETGMTPSAFKRNSSPQHRDISD